MSFQNDPNNCNLYCKHCYTESDSKNKKFINLTTIKDRVREAIDLGIYTFSFTGGEIFTLDYIYDLFYYLEKFPVKYNIFTNLTLLDEEQLKVLSELKGLSRIMTSIDYSNPVEHDSFRGKKGSFALTKKSALYLANKGKKVTINSMLMDNNYMQTQELMNLFNHKNINFKFDCIMNSGRAKNSETAFISEGILNTASLYFKPNTMGCGVGKSLIFIDYHNQICVCPSLTSNESKKFILADSILESITNLKNLSNSFDCIEECEFSKDCTNGCRARSFQEYGKLDGCDRIMHSLFTVLKKGE